MKKKDSQAKRTAEEFLNLEGIYGDLLYTRDRYVIGFLQVQGTDNQLMEGNERQNLANKLATALTDQKNPFQILSVPRTVDVSGMIGRLEQRLAATSNEVLQRLLSDEIGSLQQLMEDGAKEPIVLVKLWEKAAPGADRRLSNRSALLASRLTDGLVSVRKLKNEDLKWLCRLYANLDLSLPKDNSDSDVPILQGQKRFGTTKVPENEAALLLREITPVGGLTFGRNTVQIGNVIGRCFGVTGYPAEVDYGWLAKLVGCTTAICCITYYPGDAELANRLSKSIRQSSLGAAQSGDARTQKQYLRRAEGADKLLEDIDARRLAIGHLSIVLMPFTDDESQLADVCRDTVALCSAAKLRCKSLGNQQKDAFRHISPYYVNQPRIDQMLKQIIPLGTVTGGEPMTVSLLRDDNGVYFGRNVDGAPMCVDMLLRSDTRTDSNLIATGKSGRGKSTAIKHLLMAQYMMGVRVMVIDPEREYKELCRNLGGVWLDAGGGTAKSNPLQVRVVPEDDEDEPDPLYRSCPNAMAEHLQTLKVLLRFRIPSLTDQQLSLLEQSVTELYLRFGITAETDFMTVSPEAYPIMSDWYDLLMEKKAEDAAYGDLATLLWPMAHGADSVLWNGHTNIDLNAPFVVIDTNRLLNISPEQQTASYFNLLSMCWDNASRNRQEPVIIMADESHVLFNPALPEAGMYIRNMAKRLRKYEGGIWLAFQSVNDLLDDRVRLCGQAVIDNSAYRLLFGCDARNLDDTASLFKLTESEKGLLASARRGTALCLIGQQHLRVDFVIPDYKLKLMGTGGGR